MKGKAVSYNLYMSMYGHLLTFFIYMYVKDWMFYLFNPQYNLQVPSQRQVSKAQRPYKIMHLFITLSKF